jgi:predicted RNA binding protein YcfA (HicA-like mRNA interferase family)
MARPLPVISAQEAVSALERAGFVYVSQRGSHRKYRHPQTGRRCVVPMHRTLATGTLASVLRQAGLSTEEFVAHLR